jgi:hypothetical protein
LGRARRAAVLRGDLAAAVAICATAERGDLCHGLRKLLKISIASCYASMSLDDRPMC